MLHSPDKLLNIVKNAPLDTVVLCMLLVTFSFCRCLLLICVCYDFLISRFTYHFKTRCQRFISLTNCHTLLKSAPLDAVVLCMLGVTLVGEKWRWLFSFTFCWLYHFPLWLVVITRPPFGRPQTTEIDFLPLCLVVITRPPFGRPQTTEIDFLPLCMLLVGDRGFVYAFGHIFILSLFIANLCVL